MSRPPPLYVRAKDGCAAIAVPDQRTATSRSRPHCGRRSAHAARLRVSRGEKYMQRLDLEFPLDALPLSRELVIEFAEQSRRERDGAIGLRCLVRAE